MAAPVAAALATNPVGIGLVALGAVFKLFGAKKKRQAAKKQAAARDLRNRIVEINNSVARRNAIRQARAARAGVVAAGVNSGAAMGSSSPLGAEQSIFSQTEFGFKKAGLEGQLNRQANAFDNSAARKLSQASTLDTIGGISSGFGGALGGYDSIGGIFAQSPAPTSSSAVSGASSLSIFDPAIVGE